MKPESPLATLFDLSPKKPTTRMLARILKEGGTAALPGAVRRPDDVTYQEIICRSALNKVEGMPFKWTLNPYRGCSHGCHYCFARRYQHQLEMGPGEDFSSVVLVKINFPEILGRELARPSWKQEPIAFGTATDPYQPIEGHYKLTRRSLEALLHNPAPVGLITKGPMAVRDKDLLAELTRRSRSSVYFSVPTVDEDAWRALEPGTAHPLQRLRAVRELVDAGVNAGVLMAPIVPGFTSQPARLEKTIKEIARHGAAFVGASLLHLEGGTRAHFLRYLSKEFPQLLRQYECLYAGKYAPRSYAQSVRAVIGMLQQRYHVSGRPPAPPPAPISQESRASQPEFSW